MLELPGITETTAAMTKKAKKAIKRQLVRETVHGEPYEYYPLGKYIVAAPGVCGGRPTIKYHRLDARHIIGFLKRGDTPNQIARNYHIPLAAVQEAARLASLYNYEKCYAGKRNTSGSESETETAYLLKSQNMNRRIVEAKNRREGIGFEEAREKLGL